MNTKCCRIVSAAAVLDEHEADAVRIEGDRISAVGRRDELVRTAPADAERFHVPGGLICPGFHEGHGHLVMTALAGRELDLSGLSQAEALERMASAFRVAARTDWVIGNGLLPGVLDDPRRSPRDLLDRAVPGAPAMMRAHDLHAVYLNTQALVRTGFFVAPANGQAEFVDVGDDGKPTGRLIESAAWTADRIVRSTRTDDRVAAALEAVPGLHAAGIVAFHEMSGSTDLDVLRGIDADGLLDIDVFASVSPEDASRSELLAPGRRLSVRGVKVFLDGSLGSRSAALLEPYRNMGDQCGYLRHEPDALCEIVARAALAGLPSWIHAIGDRAVRVALDALATRPGLRHRIEHAQMIHPDDLRRFARLGVVASVQPAHILDDAYWVHRLWGERSSRAFPLRNLVDAGATLAFGSDTPVAPFDVLEGVRAALERTGREGDELHVEQSLTVGESLRAFSAGAAHAAGAEAELGSVAAGRIASLAVLSHDIVRDPAALADCAVAATFVRGALVHVRDVA